TGLTQAAKVAVFVVGLAAATYVIFRMVSKDSSSGGTYTVFTHLKDATGLVPKSRIKIAGIAVGYIDSVALDHDQAKITIKIDTILGNVEAVTGDFRSLLEQDRAGLKGDPNSGLATVRDTLDRLNSASKNLDSTLKHTDSVFARIDKGEGTLGRLTTDQTLI